MRSKGMLQPSHTTVKTFGMTSPKPATWHEPRRRPSDREPSREGCYAGGYVDTSEHGTDCYSWQEAV